MRLKIVALALPLALFASVANAAQMDPRSEPNASGPLIKANEVYTTEESPRCGKQETTTFDGELAGVTRLCYTFYRFDPAQETDSARDYGVWWIQGTITPKNGWCAKKFKTDISLSSGGTYHAFTGKDFSAGSPKTVTANLKVDAEGTASTPATVKKSFTLYPGTISAGFVKKNHTLNLVWRGATKRTVALAGGVEGSWASDGGGPGAFFSGAQPSLTDGC